MFSCGVTNSADYSTSRRKNDDARTEEKPARIDERLYTERVTGAEADGLPVT